MQRSIATSLIAIAIVIAGGCTSERAPQVLRSKNKGPAPPSAHVLPLNWSLDSLRPDQPTVLIDGKTVPVAIDMTASGEGHYLLQLSVNRKHFRPFILKMVQGAAEVDFSGTITWFPKAKGNGETVTVELYSLEEPDSGRTMVKTLLRQIRRNYDVVCNPKQWGVILFFKRHLGFCHCAPQTVKNIQP